MRAFVRQVGFNACVVTFEDIYIDLPNSVQRQIP